MLSYLSSFNIMDLLTFQNFVAIFGGGFLGMLIGALPGLGSTFAMIIMLPLTYGMEPVSAILMLLSGFQSANYGGSISSIIISIPGTPAAIPTMLDGVPIARNQSPGKALGYSLVASTIGGFFGGFVIIFLAAPVANLAMKLTAPEYFLIALIGVCAATAIGSKDLVKGLLSVCIGLMFSTIGTDTFNANYRYTFDSLHLMDGVRVMAFLIGMFAIPEIFNMVGSLNTVYAKVGGSNMRATLTWAELKACLPATLLGCVIGTISGTLPGLGSTPSVLLAYSAAEKMSKTKDKIPFGTGNPEGICAPEASNNAGVGGEIIPLLIFGIPSTPVVAVVLGAFILHGIKPGPAIFTENPQMVSTLFIGFLFTTVAMYILGLFFTSAFARALTVPNRLLVPIIGVFSIIGAYSDKNSVFDVWCALALGVIAFFLVRFEFSMSSLVLSYVLGSLIEKNFRRALLTSGGDYSVFYSRLPSQLILGAVAVVIIATIVFKLIAKRKNKATMA